MTGRVAMTTHNNLGRQNKCEFDSFISLFFYWILSAVLHTNETLPRFIFNSCH